jgi:hypothetical protein
MGNKIVKGTIIETKILLNIHLKTGIKKLINKKQFKELLFILNTNWYFKTITITGNSRKPY